MSNNPKISVLPDHPDPTTTTTTTTLPLPPWKRTTSTSSPEIFSRISSFLPQLQAANAQLESDITSGKISEKQIENVGEDEEQYIEMNLGLGVLEEKKRASGSRRKRRRHGPAGLEEVAVAADGGNVMMGAGVEAKMVGEEAETTDTATSTVDEDEEGEEEEDDDDDDDDDEDDDDDDDDDEDDDDDDDSEEEDDDDAESDSDEQDSEEEEEEESDGDDEAARIDALLSVLGVESPQLDRKRKRRHNEHKMVQRDILAALLNMDAPGVIGGVGGVRPVIEVVEGKD